MRKLITRCSGYPPVSQPCALLVVEHCCRAMLECLCCVYGGGSLQRALLALAADCRCEGLPCWLLRARGMPRPALTTRWLLHKSYSCVLKPRCSGALCCRLGWFFAGVPAGHPAAATPCLSQDTDAARSAVISKQKHAWKGHEGMCACTKPPAAGCCNNNKRHSLLARVDPDNRPVALRDGLTAA